jgi:REP element-mobilizing transposase RayT
MPRRPRIEFAEAIHHVTMRGVNRSAVFRDDIDRWAFEQLLEATCKKHRWRCLAHCLMDDQIQLVIRTLAPNLCRGMQFLSSAYTRRHHGRHRASGPLFQGGHQSLLVRRDAYLLEVVRYVLLNPVRAGLCHAPADWRWSSARAALRLRPTPAWADFTIIYELLGPLDDRSPQRLQQFLRDGYEEVPGTRLAPLGY